MTTLPEPLHSSASVTTNEHPYMRIDIPPPPWRNQNVQLCWLAKCTPSQQPIHPTPPKPRVSIAAEVNDLLTWAMVDESSCKLEHSPIGKAAMVEAVTSQPHKSEASPCQLTLLPMQVWRRQRPLSKVSLPTSPLSPPRVAAAVLVHQWTPQNFKPMPTWLLTTCSA